MEFGEFGWVRVEEEEEVSEGLREKAVVVEGVVVVVEVA